MKTSLSRSGKLCDSSVSWKCGDSTRSKKLCDVNVSRL